MAACDGGLDDVREFLSGRWSAGTNAINCSLLSCCKSLRSINPWMQTSTLRQGVGHYVFPCAETTTVMAGLDPATSIGRALPSGSATVEPRRIGVPGSSPGMTGEVLAQGRE